MNDAITLRRRRFLGSIGAAWGSTLGLSWIANAYAANAKKIALVLGNAAYQANERLKNPVADATLTANTLTKLGFITTLLTDRTAQQLKGDLDAFALAAKGADIAVFFYAGHGIAVENVNYLVPVDQRVAALKSLDLKRDGISLSWIESVMAQTNAAVSVLVIDACRNQLMRSTRQQGMAPPSKAPHGTLTFFSTAPGALASDGSGKNSDFSTAFNNYLSQTELSLMQVVQSTQSEVSAATGETQIPWVNSGLVGDVRLATAERLERPPMAPARKATTDVRGGDGSQPKIRAQANFWNENLARLDEQIQFEAMNMDANTKLVLDIRAAKGDVMALTTLGLAYSTPDTPKAQTIHGAYGLETKTQVKGYRFVPYDPAHAVRYLSQAAEMHFPVAQTILAELLVESPRGVPRDYQRARRLLEEAANTGYGRARLDLLDLHARTGQSRSDELAKDIMNNSSTSLKYVERFGKVQGQ